MDHSSLSRFSIGVPVSAKRCSAFSVLTAFAACEAAFFIYFAYYRKTFVS